MYPPPEYRPGLPEQNDNISHNHPLKEFAVLLAGVMVFLLLAVWSLGLLVDWAAGVISPEMEAVIFSSMQFSGATVFDKKQDDPRRVELQRLVDALGRCNEVGYPLQVRMAQSNDANAFAFPGGRIIVLEGLLDKVCSENGLAFVLAHEMAHFKHRDHLRAMGRGLVFTSLSALLTGAGSDLTKLIAPALGMGQARYSQEREALADRQALETLNCFYGHVGGATEFFVAMQEEVGEQGRGIGRYFASHPEAVQRINALRSLTRASGFAVQAPAPLPTTLASASPQ
ncbi:MAG: M48 family metallopeptidase [Candidatus Electrothrix sp. GW3-4]|uniref:M48 family metallopeptidase n=1 Tax=Candidatus Electrothrix sp. GW3-4 TaxID=3126740 RepID=UPI0030D31D93